MIKKLLIYLILLCFYFSGLAQKGTPSAIRESFISPKKSDAPLAIKYPVKTSAKKIVQNIFSGEICNNGIDDDGDNLIDLNDTVDCKCNGLSGHYNSGIAMIPNPSFDTMACCPSTYSEVNCSQGWIQASSSTSDYMNTCGFVFGAATDAGLVPFPHGNGIMGCIFAPTWQEYIGTCLTSPMLAGHKYSIQMDIASTPIDGSGNTCNGDTIYYSDIDIVIYGAISCSSLPFNGTACPPTPDWQVLGQTNYTPVSSWGIITIVFTPTVNINSIIIGSPCTLPPSYTYGPTCYPYFYFDNFLVNSSISVLQSGNACQNNIVLTTQTDTTGGTWQWYENGVALTGQTNDTLNVSANSLPAGIYTAVYTIGSNCEEISDSVSIVCNTTDINQSARNNEPFTIYPNPNNGTFIFESHANQKQTLQILDVTGKIVLSQTVIGATTIDASKLSEGVYTIKINGGQSNLTKKLVIVK